MTSKKQNQKRYLCFFFIQKRYFFSIPAGKKTFIGEKTPPTSLFLMTSFFFLKEWEVFLCFFFFLDCWSFISAFPTFPKKCALLILPKHLKQHKKNGSPPPAQKKKPLSHQKHQKLSILLIFFFSLVWILCVFFFFSSPHLLFHISTLFCVSDVHRGNVFEVGKLVQGFPTDILYLLLT